MVGSRSEPSEASDGEGRGRFNDKEIQVGPDYHAMWLACQFSLRRSALLADSPRHVVRFFVAIVRSSPKMSLYVLDV
eukprot:COSAG02_NODE_985_length_15457_cov_108.738247_5_plen_77_part_00